MLKVSPWKSGVHFGKSGKLSPRYIGPFEITERIGPAAYRLKLPQELSEIHDTFHVSNLKKCLSDESLIIPLEEVQVDPKLNFVEEPIEIMDHKVKQLKQSRIPLVKMTSSNPIILTDSDTEFEETVQEQANTILEFMDETESEPEMQSEPKEEDEPKEEEREEDPEEEPESES
ncbi:uncharacterized protein [Rutidosis leptorrhynchoides]|uniref:uncharacterized protein n=1 Tax=Rutidosis leptorrhynchoides TaxID=125765 RepID=UPI003A999B59